jgi:hypothetical protein
MPTFRDVDHDPFAEVQAKGPTFRDVDHDPFAETEPSSMAGDIAKGAGIGLAKGAIGMVGIPGDLNNLLKRGNAWAAETFPSIARKRGEDENLLPAPPTSEDIQHGVEKVTGKFYEPQTRAGRVAQTAGEFVPAMAAGGPAGILRRAGIGAAAGASSEAAGQAVEGSAAEPWIRLGTALGVGGVGGVVTQPRTAINLVKAQMPSYVNDASVTAADSLIKDASQRGVTLTWPEALSQVTGKPVLNDMQRFVEGAKQSRATMHEALGDRPQQVEGAARGMAGSIAPQTAAPSAIGPAAGTAAEGGINDVRQTINQVSEPYYAAASTHTLTPPEMAQVKAIPGYAAAAKQVRSDPQLNRNVANLPDNSIGFLNQVKKVLDEGAENAASPVQQGRSVERAAGLRSDASAVRDASLQSEAAAGKNDYANALAVQKMGREKYLSPLMDGPLGKLADKDISTQKAISALFPAEPLAGGEKEITKAVETMASKNPEAARQLVRAHVEQKLEEAFNAAGRTPEAAGAAGAGLAQRLTGSPVVPSQRGANFRAAVEALPGGKQKWPGIERFLDVMRATGWRQPIGSKTTFNTMEEHGMAHGKMIGNVVAKALSPGEWMHEVQELWGKWQTGNNLQGLAKLLTDPKASNTFREIAKMPSQGTRIRDAAVRLTAGLSVPSVRKFNNSRQ